VYAAAAAAATAATANPFAAFSLQIQDS